MAFLRYANARFVHPVVSGQGWDNVRTAAAKAKMDRSLVDQASKILKEDFDPKNYLLSHATIVASVDTVTVKNAKLGSSVVNGKKVVRKTTSYRVKPECQKFINNNADCWSRGVLLKSYPTFIGAHNFLEHVQIEDLSKGRILDAVARDIGDSLYVDILIATSRKHRELIEAIESGELSTLSMGCFVPGTQVTMADGTRVAIEDVQVGDKVLTHKGRAREVLNKQIRENKGGRWSVRRIEAVGVPSAITATDVHPFFVYRIPDVCSCGCGEVLPASYSSGKKASLPSRLTRRFKDGHNLRILNPNGTYSLEERAARKARLEDLLTPKLEEVKAADLKVGDFLVFPRANFEARADTTPGRARLLGYFLAEGNFQKRDEKYHTVEFNFALQEKDTYAAEVVRLLSEEFPGCNPRVYTKGEDDGCSTTVVVTNETLAAWFLKHGGEYSHGKRLHPDVMLWTVENQLQLLGAWINGDGTLQKAGITSVTTVSYDLACQMHVLMARCGVCPRMYGLAQGGSVDVAEVVNGGLVPYRCGDGSLRRPAFQLDLGQTQAQPLRGYTDKIKLDPTFQTQACRVRDDVVMFPITSIEAQTYEGWVHDMEVEEDHSYVVEGVAVHNCSIDGSTCTKCGHWAADETEFCDHVKYEKGNLFIDELGNQSRVAELCGDESLDPTGGNTFIEASWVKIPAFKGAVRRNILTLSSGDRTKTSMKVSTAVESVSDPVLDDPRMRKAAKLAFGEEDMGGDAPAESPTAPATSPDPLKDLEEDVKQHLLDRVRKSLKEDLDKSDLADAIMPPSASMEPNDTIVKQAGLKRAKYLNDVRRVLLASKNDQDVIRGIALLNADNAIFVPKVLYRAALKVGGTHRYASLQNFLDKCAGVLDRPPTVDESKILIRLAKLLTIRRVGVKPKQRTGV